MSYLGILFPRVLSSFGIIIKEGPLLFPLSFPHIISYLCDLRLPHSFFKKSWFGVIYFLIIIVFCLFGFLFLFFYHGLALFLSLHFCSLSPSLSHPLPDSFLSIIPFFFSFIYSPSSFPLSPFLITISNRNQNIT